MKQENKEEDIRSIYREYVEDVYRFVAVFTANNEEAEDVTQEVFIRLVDSIHKFKGRSSLKTWIFSIARNVAIDYVRKQKKQLFLKALKKYKPTFSVPSIMVAMAPPVARLLRETHS
ncbi:RNA polymerase sigma factor [Bacillus alkalicellulosilyticus]|uniref:RNA polymerase sigma factor n=1 Tax=Alkalihalobacterium alkalicellulosilyticum TaxID=1912214 RepID=UPI00099626B4|nr:RNA polymerase sigma factor [Bacillus alkalicellulosilyticus]